MVVAKFELDVDHEVEDRDWDLGCCSVLSIIQNTYSLLDSILRLTNITFYYLHRGKICEQNYFLGFVIGKTAGITTDDISCDDGDIVV